MRPYTVFIFKGSFFKYILFDSVYAKNSCLRLQILLLVYIISCCGLFSVLSRFNSISFQCTNILFQERYALQVSYTNISLSIRSFLQLSMFQVMGKVYPNCTKLLLPLLQIIASLLTISYNCIYEHFFIQHTITDSLLCHRRII